MPETSPSREQLAATGINFITAYNEWSLQAILGIRSPGCIHHTLPASLNVPPRSNAEYKTFMEPMLSIFRGVDFSVINSDDIVIDVEARRVILHCINRADTDAGEYTNEYIFSLSMSEDGAKLDKIVEFIDTAYTIEFKRRIASIRTSAHA